MCLNILPHILPEQAQDNPNTARVRIRVGDSLAGIRSAASSVQIESYTYLLLCVMGFNEVLRDAFKIRPLSEQGINIFQYSPVYCNIKSNLTRF
jgi:hypothetical protein